MVPPRLDQYLCLGDNLEYLVIEQLISQRTAEAPGESQRQVLAFSVIHMLASERLNLVACCRKPNAASWDKTAVPAHDGKCQVSDKPAGCHAGRPAVP
jgi:hypothetical protein